MPSQPIHEAANEADVIAPSTPPPRKQLNEPTNLRAPPLDLVSLRQFLGQRLLSFLELPLRLQAHDAAAPGVARHVVVHGLEGGL